MKIISRIGHAILLAFWLVPGLMWPGGCLKAAQDPVYLERHFDEEKLSRFREMEDFRYERASAGEQQERKKSKESRKSADRMPDFSKPGDRLGMSDIGKAIMWILIIIGGGLVILQLLKVDFRKLIKKEADLATVLPLEDLPEEEDIRSMKFDDLLDAAVKEGRFRYAVRLLYLRILSQLSEDGRIQWRREKTNQEYLQELNDRQLKSVFGDITFIFEYIWYGEFPVDQDHYNTAKVNFNRIEKHLAAPRSEE